MLAASKLSPTLHAKKDWSFSMAEQTAATPRAGAPVHHVADVSKVGVVVAMTDATKRQKRQKNLKKL